MIKFIITGTGRCGTCFISKVFNSLGISCGHESIFGPVGKEEVVNRLSGKSEPVISEVFQLIKDDIKPNLKLLQADSSYMAAPYLDLVPDVKIIHLVRHPLKVISSFVFDFKYFQDESDADEYKEWIYDHTPQLLNIPDSINRCAYYYIYWNKLIEDNCADRQCYIHRVEEDFNQFFFNFIGHSTTDKIYDNKTANSSKNKNKPKLSIEDISDIEIRENLISLAHRYGYRLSM